jgi:hypothetical protein
MISDEVRLEVCQVETTVVAHSKLIHYIQHNLMSFPGGYELLCQSFAEFVNLKKKVIILRWITCS